MTKVIERIDLQGNDCCYELYRVYPGGTKWFCGYFRSHEDFDAEVKRLNKVEFGPDNFIAEKVPSNGIPLNKITDAVETSKRRAREDKQRAIELKKWQAEHNAAIEKWKREEAEWRKNHPNQKHPNLMRRSFPPLFPNRTVCPLFGSPNGIRQALRFLYPDSEGCVPQKG